MKKLIALILLILSILIVEPGCDKESQKVDPDIDGTDIWTPSPK
jgi:hypothetical protein